LGRGGGKEEGIKSEKGDPLRIRKGRERRKLEWDGIFDRPEKRKGRRKESVDQ